ncbi:hypothetical protein Gasu2_16190 [Galdieria sulphuraria]|uniref:LisH domain-containing protein n=1 Tax=Galdieria sulphuraria TaxID=130081 RepID=M2W6J5_GALSU|nr:uncharacterized protein Gasu_13350 [Galdieria sulphuraria]EME31371.1 hypothetical protein Gasu_13350 [Galdieria sulphuraria]GJD07251.1 hypothetical protein Gasu2_16190 [Galdieria sulphuraria]|eukprot:XP_005707891.1 hypothetical protein Gasu_13350 [Galdieria sulphuraria]
MEHCDCYKKELVELFIRFLKKEGLTCTLSVFKTEIMSLRSVHLFPSDSLQPNEMCGETVQAEDNRSKRPRSPTLQENMQPNTVFDLKVNGISSPGTHNVSDSRAMEGMKKQKFEIPPKNEGHPEQADRNLSNVAMFAQSGTKLLSVKPSSDLIHSSKQHTFLPDRSQSSRIVASNLSQKGRDTNSSEKEQRKKVVFDSKSRNSGSFEESIRNVTESLRYDPSFQENLRNILRNDHLSMGWLSLPQNESKSLQEESDVSVLESETFSGDSLQKQGNELAGKIDKSLDSSVGGFLETIDLDAFLGSIHAASNH